MRNKVAAFLFLISVLSNAQVVLSDFEKYPVFQECKDASINRLPDCFNQTIVDFITKNLKVPDKVFQEQFEGKIVLLFEVTREGKFRLLYTDAIYKELKIAAQEVFDLLPVIEPATYNSEATYMQFSLPVLLPLSRNKIESNLMESTGASPRLNKPDVNATENKLQTEYDRIQNKIFDLKNESKSHLNIPLSHQIYSRFDQELNSVGVNTHTASKPFLYSSVDPYYDFTEKAAILRKPKTTWLGRKWYNEHMVQIQGDNYWITLDPAADLQLGYETDELKKNSFTYNNTRAVFVQGGLGKKINFFAAVYESQGRFAQYYNDIIRSLRPDGGNPGIVPGRGIAKEGRKGDFDYPTAGGIYFLHT